ncbi:hypothetical protein [uncultured Litoreibacter sp.]|uniref:hypothetical protein n=1 Tax=uncultured Litoreibacter sp. TaxID=1392394 RepID=UPI0026073D65|nr:hypothetical protein [uncultured Litoreibacter sp.]
MRARLRAFHCAGIALMALFALLAALQYQRAALQITETQIIETYASQYLATAPKGAKLTDCKAKPGPQSHIRMVVICGPARFDADRHYEYHVGPLGGLIVKHGPGDWVTQEPVAGRDAA